MKQFLSKHDRNLSPRPARSSNITDKIERSNAVFKNIIKLLQKADAKATPDVIFTSSSFITNLTRGSKLMNSFQMAQGYSPSVFGIPIENVSQDLLDAQMDREEIRAIEIMLK